MSAAMTYRPARRRRRVPRPRSLIAAALIVCAGSVALDRMTPATPRPVVAAVVSAHEVDVMHAAAHGVATPRPAVAGKAAKHHPLRALMLLRHVAHVHRIFYWRRSYLLRRLFR